MCVSSVIQKIALFHFSITLEAFPSTIILPKVRLRRTFGSFMTAKLTLATTLPACEAGWTTVMTRIACFWRMSLLGKIPGQECWRLPSFLIQQFTLQNFLQTEEIFWIKCFLIRPWRIWRRSRGVGAAIALKSTHLLSVRVVLEDGASFSTKNKLMH